MRATQRITWLLLTAGILFHICAADDSVTATSVSKDAVTTTALPTVAVTSLKVTTAAAVTTTVMPTVPQTSKPTQAPTDAASTPAATVAAPATTTVNPTTPQPTAAIVTSAQPAASTTISGASTALPNKSTAVTASPTPSKTLDSAATTAASSSSSSAAASSSSSSSSGGGSSSSGGGLAVSPSAPTVQTTNPPGVGFTGTGAATTQPGGPGNVGTTKSSKTSTDAAPSGQPTTINTHISSGTSQQAGKAGTEKMTVTVTSRQPTASRDPQLPGNTGTTLSPDTKSVGIPGIRTDATSPQATINTITGAQPKVFQYSLNTGQEKDEEKELVEVCKQLMVKMQDGNCTLTWRHHNGKVQFDCVEINGKVKTSLATQIYEEITKKQTDNKTLIAILASCGALLIMIVILAVCASHHRKPYHENQQHLTEELHTVENGYHDNPTLEVMEVQPEMQEKKMALNGEFNDSWIVPIDNLLKEDIPDEEDTHL